MRTDILDLHDFYEDRLGRLSRTFIAARLREIWGRAEGVRVAGFGHAEPFLDQFDRAERRIALASGAQGVIHWPVGKANRACLVDDYHWPLPNASMDRILLVHGLEETGDPRRLMREIWRVLSDDGRLVIVAAHRRGLWSMVDSTPFAAGRPYLKGQLDRLLSASMFRAEAWSGALYFPPFRFGAFLRLARTWERTGADLWPAFAGVLMVEASKDMAAPVGRARVAAPVRAIAAAPRPAPLGRSKAPRTRF